MSVSTGETTDVAAAAQPRRRVPRVLLVLMAVAVVALTVVVVTAVRVLVVAGQDDRTPTDAILVLGAAQFDGTPSPVLAARLEHAHTLYDAGVAPRVITVGGNQPGDRTTEAAAGAQWLEDQGVDADDVVAVEAGSDTVESVQAVAQVMRENGWDSVTVVTDPAHEARSVAIARALGLQAHASPSTSGAGTALSFDYVVRETGGLLRFWGVQQWSLDQA